MTDVCANSKRCQTPLFKWEKWRWKLRTPAPQRKRLSTRKPSSTKGFNIKLYVQLLVSPNTEVNGNGFSLVSANTEVNGNGFSLVSANTEVNDNGSTLVSPNTEVNGNGFSLVLPNTEVNDNGSTLVSPNTEVNGNGFLPVSPNTEVNVNGFSLVSPNTEVYDSGSTLVSPNTEVNGNGSSLVSPNTEVNGNGLTLILANTDVNGNGFSLVSQITEVKSKDENCVDIDENMQTGEVSSDYHESGTSPQRESNQASSGFISSNSTSHYDDDLEDVNNEEHMTYAVRMNDNKSTLQQDLQEMILELIAQLTDVKESSDLWCNELFHLLGDVPGVQLGRQTVIGLDNLDQESVSLNDLTRASAKGQQRASQPEDMIENYWFLSTLKRKIMKIERLIATMNRFKRLAAGTHKRTWRIRNQFPEASYTSISTQRSNSCDMETFSCSTLTDNVEQAHFVPAEHGANVDNIRMDTFTEPQQITPSVSAMSNLNFVAQQNRSGLSSGELDQLSEDQNNVEAGESSIFPSFDADNLFDFFSISCLPSLILLDSLQSIENRMNQSSQHQDDEARNLVSAAISNDLHMEPQENVENESVMLQNQENLVSVILNDRHEKPQENVENESVMLQNQENLVSTISNDQHMKPQENVEHDTERFVNQFLVVDHLIANASMSLSSRSCLAFDVGIVRLDLTNFSNSWENVDNDQETLHGQHAGPVVTNNRSGSTHSHDISRGTAQSHIDENGHIASQGHFESIRSWREEIEHSSQVVINSTSRETSLTTDAEPGTIFLFPPIESDIAYHSVSNQPDSDEESLVIGASAPDNAMQQIRANSSAILLGRQNSQIDIEEVQQEAARIPRIQLENGVAVYDTDLRLTVDSTNPPYQISTDVAIHGGDVYPYEFTVIDISVMKHQPR